MKSYYIVVTTPGVCAYTELLDVAVIHTTLNGCWEKNIHHHNEECARMLETRDNSRIICSCYCLCSMECLAGNNNVY